MSDETKKNLEQVKKLFEIIKENAHEVGEEASKLDKDLGEKIEKVEQAAEEVVKHVEEKSD